MTRCLFETLVCSLVRLSAVLTSVVAALTVVFSAMLNVAVLDIESWKSCRFSEEWQPSVLLSANDPISHYVFSFTALLIAAWLALLFFCKEKMSRIHYGQVKTNDLWLIVNAFLPFLPACAFGLLLHEDESLGFLIAFALSWAGFATLF